jgi:hypothetical protein
MANLLIDRAWTTLTDQEKENAIDVVNAMRLITEDTGWGELTIIFKGGTLDEIKAQISRRKKYLQQ